MKDKSELQADIAAELADASGITAARLRPVLSDIVDSITQSAAAAGSGTPYVLTASTAPVSFSVDDPDVGLPGAGTWLLIASAQILAAAAGAGDEVRIKLRDVTAGADIGIERRVTMPANDALVPIDLVEAVTVANPATVQIWAHNDTAAQGEILSTTSLRYVRLS